MLNGRIGCSPAAPEKSGTFGGPSATALESAVQGKDR